MLLTSQLKIRMVTHEVRPTKHMMHDTPEHRSQIEVMVDVEAPEQWVVWAFPNRNRVYSAWQFKQVDPIDASIIARTPARLVIADSINDLLRKVRWDDVHDRILTFGDAIEKMQAAYGEHHGLVAARFDRSGTYALSWTWYGAEPYACTSWLADPPTDVSVALHGATVIEWVTPGLGDPGPKGQRLSGGVIRVQLAPDARCSDLIGRNSGRAKPRSLETCALM